MRYYFMIFLFGQLLATVLWAQDNKSAMARELMNAGNYSAALPLLTAIINDPVILTPQKADALFAQAQAYYQLKQYANLRALCDSYLNEYANEKNAPQILYWLAWRDNEERKFSSALTHYENFLTQYPTHELSNQVRYALAQILLPLNREADAAQLFLQIPRHAITFTVSEYLWLAQYLTKNGQDELARDYYQQVINATSAMTDSATKITRNLAHLGLAKTARALGDLEAAGDFLSIVENDAQLKMHVDYERGLLWLAQKNYTAAAEHLLLVGFFCADENLAGDALWSAAIASKENNDLARAKICYEELSGALEDSYGARYPNNQYQQRAQTELNERP